MKLLQCDSISFFGTNHNEKAEVSRKPRLIAKWIKVNEKPTCKWILDDPNQFD